MFLEKEKIELLEKHIKGRESREAFYELASIIAYDGNIDTKTIKKLFEIYNRSKYEQKLKIDLEREKEVEFLGRLRGWKVDNNRIIAKIGNSLKVEIPLSMFEDADADEIFDSLNKLIYMKIKKVKRRRGYRITVDELEVYETDCDVEAAKKIIEKEHPIKVLVEALGFNFNYYTFRANLPRIIALFKVPVDPYASSAIHIVQFTIPATGKSTTMYKLSNILNLEVVSGGLPSSAKLIYNASSQEFGLVFTRDYIVIDEFDKSLNSKSEAYDFFSKIEMGMANGKWTREKYTKRHISEIRKDTTLIFFGNLEGKLLSEAPNTRMYLRKFLEQKLESEAVPHAFIDRLVIIDIYDKEPLIRMTHNKVVIGSVLKGLFALLNERANEIETKDFDLHGRLVLYARQVYKVLRALQIDESLAYEFAKNLVLGEKRVEELYQEAYKQITGQEPEKQWDVEI